MTMPALALWHTAPDGSPGDFLPHHTLEPKVITMAATVIGSWADYGITPENDLPDHMMPTPELEEIAAFLREVISEGITGRAELTEQAALRDSGHGELMRRVLGCFSESEFMLHRPQGMVNYVAKVRGHWLCKQQGYLTFRIQECLKEGGDPTNLIGELKTLTDTALEHTSGEKPRDYLRADEITEVVETMDFVQDLLTENSTILIYGPSNAGKSYWALDLAAHVATGKPWRNGEAAVDQGAVLYVGLEGEEGVQNRINALKQEGILTPGAPFYSYRVPVSLIDSGDIRRLVRNLSDIMRDAGMPVKLVILDTLARAMAGGDENSGQDMSAAIATVDGIRRHHRVAVALIHHPGKDSTKGARGHSSLRAAVDTEIEVTRSHQTGISTARVTKQRDLPARPPMPFSLAVVELGTNRRGEPITTCVVRHESVSMAPKPVKQGRKTVYDPEKLLELLPMANSTAWKEAAEKQIGIGRSLFYELQLILKDSGEIHIDPETKRITRIHSSQSTNPESPEMDLMDCGLSRQSTVH